MGPVESYSYTFPNALMPMWHFVFFALGCSIGSFLNVCIWRIPNNMRLASPPSHCPNCKHPIPWYENLPLISWLMLRGKCSSCKVKISSRYFFVELLCGVLFYLLWFKILLDKEPISLLIMDYIVTAFIVTMAFIDYDHRIIPDKTTYPLMMLGLAAAPVFPELWGMESSLNALIWSAGSLVGTGLIMAGFSIMGKVIFKQDALGWGDVKYMMAIAACLGPKAAFCTLLLGSLLGSIIGIAMIFIKKGKMRTTIPFGPFLAVGTYLWMLYGSRLELLYKAFFSWLKG